MKKVLLSLALILGFGVYAYTQRHNSAGSVAALPDSSQTSSGQTGSNSNSDSGSTGSNTTDPTPPSQTPASTPAPPPVQKSKYKDGAFTGPVTDAFYGNIQVQAVISGGKLTNVKFLQYPNDQRTSIEVNTEAMPQLTQEAIRAQSANVDIVSGATQTSEAFRSSLGSALHQALNN